MTGRCLVATRTAQAQARSDATQQLAIIESSPYSTVLLVTSSLLPVLMSYNIDHNMSVDNLVISNNGLYVE